MKTAGVVRKQIFAGSERDFLTFKTGIFANRDFLTHPRRVVCASLIKICSRISIFFGVMMSEKSMYKKTEITKSGKIIPAFENGRTVESKYNPELEARRIADSVSAEKKYEFFVILGIASGILLKTLSETFKNAKFICVEFSRADLDFITAKENRLEILNFCDDKNVILCSAENVYEILLENYLPAKYGDLKIIEQRGWINRIGENKNDLRQIYASIQKAINVVSSDFATQARFGKIWTNNIMNNLKLLQTARSDNFSANFIEINVKKTAAVIAAGPSLDKSAKILKENAQDFFIISTDTAYSSLVKRGVIPQVVISLDGQLVSKNHFLHDVDMKNTLFLFDLTSNWNAAKYCKSKNAKIYFFKSGHPFSTLAENFSKNRFLELFAGAGTVAIAATDFAVKSGFNKIQIFGADFSYRNGKSYAKGTYLDNLYNQKSRKTESGEFIFDKLMFRTELTKTADNIFTTKILQAYKLSFEEFIKRNDFSLKYENSCFYAEKKSQNPKDFQNARQKFYCDQKFDYENFLKFICAASPKSLEIPLLPLAAWIKINRKKNDFNEILNLAYSYVVEYNR